MQTWKTDQLPVGWQPTQIAINKYMPDWDYVLMTDDMNRAFVIEHFPDFLSYYDAFPYNIQRADAIRYCWLYIHGGLYLDCDIEILGPLDDLFTIEGDLFLLNSPHNGQVFTNALMASKPGQQIWLEMLEAMKQPPGLYALERHLLVMNTTGPMAFTRVIKRTQPDFVRLPVEKLSP